MSYLLLNVGTHIMGHEILEAKVYVIDADKYKTDLAHLSVETPWRTGMIEVPWYFVDEIRELVYKAGVLHETVEVLCQEVVPKPVDLSERQLLLNEGNMNGTSFKDTGLTIYSEVGEIVLSNGVVEHLRKVLVPPSPLEKKANVLPESMPDPLVLADVTRICYEKERDLIYLVRPIGQPNVVLPTDVAYAMQELCSKVSEFRNSIGACDVTIKVVPTPTDPIT